MTVEYNFDAIPDEFKQHNNWLLWKYETRGEKKTKVPYQVSGTRADSTAPNTWTSFNEVDLAYMGGGFDGIGFAIGDSGLTCVDVDHLSEWDWMPALKPIQDTCYAELSPSGDGLHVWLKAKKPNSKCKGKHFHNSMIEVYNSDRFITMTGADGDGQITECQAQFDEAFKDLFFPPTTKKQTVTKSDNVIALSLDDEQIIDRISNENSKGREDWIKWHSFGISDSEDASGCDQAYVNKLAFYTKDYAQIERIWLSSAIGQREKTLKRKDYRERTINKAIDDTETYQPTCANIQDVQIPNEPIEETDTFKDVDLISLCGDNPLAQFASELSKSAKMPRNTVFLTVLSVQSSIACRGYKVAYQHGGFQPIGINFAGEQPPGASKSRVLQTTQKPIFSELRTARGALIKRINEIKNELKECDKDDKPALSEEKAELQQQLDAMFEWITDTTPEALDTTLQDSGGYYAIASAEQGAINSLLGLSYTDAKSIANRDLALKGFNGEWHNAKRKGRATYQGDVVGTISALAQTGMITNLLRASDSSGVVERFILWSEANLLGQRDHTQYHKMDDFITTEFYENLIDIYRQAGTKAKYDDLPYLSLSVRAWNEIAQKRNELEPTIADGGENSATLLRGLIAKYDIFVMKIASNLHLSAKAFNSAMLIHDDRVSEAMAIMDAYIAHLKNLIQSSAIEALSERDEAIIEYLGHKKKTGQQIADALRRRTCFKKGGKISRDFIYETLKQLHKRDLIDAVRDLKEPSNLKKAMFSIS